MELIVTQNYKQSCQKAANMIKDIIVQKNDAKLGLATGSTPIGVYQRLVRLHQANELDFSKVRTVNLDEYVGLSSDHPQSYRYFMDKHLFDHINIHKDNTFVVSGMGDLASNALQLDRMIYQGGVPDLQLLGIGSNGHIGFNEPADTLIAESHLEQLSESTIQANARFFDKAEQVPTQAITMGIKGIFAARKILLLATGIEKKQAVSNLFQDSVICPHNPSSFLKLHANVTVIIDSQLAQHVDPQKHTICYAC